MSVKTYRRKLDIKNGRIDLSHGAGGRAMAQLISDLFHEALDNEWLRRGNDQAIFDVVAGRMVMTTDSYVVSPLFFPGGDIGSLSVHGTINDVAMGGARPLYLSASFIIEEGFALADLKRIFALVHAAMYDAWTAYDPVAVGLFTGTSLRGTGGPSTVVNKREAVSYAAYEVLRELAPVRRRALAAYMAALGYATNATSAPAMVGRRAAQRAAPHSDPPKRAGCVAG
jgi:hypothetical protein